VEELEDEPDLLAAQLCQRILAQAGDVRPVDQHRSRRWRIEARDKT
jgi:hypothetical protein